MALNDILSMFQHLRIQAVKKYECIKGQDENSDGGNIRKMKEKDYFDLFVFWGES
jgi:hypothetical protein